MLEVVEAILSLSSAASSSSSLLLLIWAPAFVPVASRAVVIGMLAELSSPWLWVQLVVVGVGVGMAATIETIVSKAVRWKIEKCMAVELDQ